MSIRRVLIDDLSAIATIHIAAFQNHFLTDLGKGFLRHYYRLILGYPSGILLIAEEVGSENPTGFVGGFVNPPAFYRSLQHKRVSLALRMIVPIIQCPKIMPRILHNRRRVSQIAGLSGTQQRVAELSSIAVHPSHRGQGVGKELVFAFTARALEMGVDTIELTADANDRYVNHFYDRLGFHREPFVYAPPARPMYKYIKYI